MVGHNSGLKIANFAFCAAKIPKMSKSAKKDPFYSQTGGPSANLSMQVDRPGRDLSNGTIDILVGCVVWPGYVVKKRVFPNHDG